MKNVEIVVFLIVQNEMEDKEAKYILYLVSITGLWRGKGSWAL